MLINLKKAGVIILVTLEYKEKNTTRINES